MKMVCYVGGKRGDSIILAAIKHWKVALLLRHLPDLQNRVRFLARESLFCTGIVTMVVLYFFSQVHRDDSVSDGKIFPVLVRNLFLFGQNGKFKFSIDFIDFFSLDKYKKCNDSYYF